jgi:proteic killer suppression protein
MILGYRDKRTEQIANGTVRKGFPKELVRRAQMKFAAMSAAVELRDLSFPPGDRLHALTGDLAAQHAIGINAQWRICFVWTDAGPDQVEICDYTRQEPKS